MGLLEWVALAAATSAPTVAPVPKPTVAPVPKPEPQIERRLDEEIVVTGAKSTYKADTVQVGAFRNRSILDTPATVNVVSRALMDDQGVQGLEGALRNMPGITQQTTSPFNTNTFVSRGVSIDASTNYRLNGGLPIINFAPMPVENKQRVELLKGVSALYYGISTPSGIINLTTKRAGLQAVTSVYTNGDSEGSIGGGFDIGRTFGADKRFGLRMNGYASSLQSTTDGVSGSREMLTGAFDWQASDSLAIRADVEYYHRAGEEQGGITLPTAVAGKITLPALPAPSTRFAPEGAPFETSGFNAALRADYALTTDWSVRVEGGVAQARRDRMIATLGSINLATGAGSLAITKTPGQFWENRYGRVELAGKIQTWGITHDLVFGAARTEQYKGEQVQIKYRALSQNLYAPVDLSLDTLVEASRATTAASKMIDTGFYAMDVIELAKSWQVVAGGRYVDYRTKANGLDYTIHTVTPTAALTFRPTSTTSIYGSYIQGLESAGTAPDTATNAGAVLGPQRSKQFEIGGRAEILGALASISWFHIDRALAYTNESNVYVVDGRALHRGVEASLQGNLSREIEVMLGGQYLDAVQSDSGVAAQNGKRVLNTARWSGSAFLQYRPSFLAGAAVNGGAYYTGDRYADALNRALLPGYTTYSIGSSYQWRLQDGRKLTVRVNADNLTDKRYWATGGTTLYVGAARTVKASLTFDL